MYVTDGKRIRKIHVCADSMNYKYAYIWTGLFKRISAWSYYSDPVKNLLKIIEPMGWKLVD